MKPVFPSAPELIEHGNGKAKGRGPAMATLLTAPEPPTAVFCYNDMMAIAALKMIRSRWLKVPEDISLIGFDDLPLGLYIEPPLTTVRQPGNEMGRLAMQVLLKMMSGIQTEQILWVTGELIVRDSAAPPKEEAHATARTA